MKKRFFGKQGIETEMLGWWIIAIVAMIIFIGGLIILKSKGINAIDYIKNLFIFGR